MHTLSAPATCGYITGNVFTHDSTVMPHVLAIVEASVHLSVTLCDCISKQCRLDCEAS